MRQIKFRAWHNLKTNPFMGYSERLGLPTFFRQCTLAQHFIIMQFTGLKDKNGKDIYEGDIVDFPDTESFYVEVIEGYGENYKVAENDLRGFGEIVFLDYAWQIKIISSCETFSESDNLYFSDFIDNVGNDIEVIGNKFENPELIKEV